MAKSTICCQWRDKGALKGFRTGVSLHSHTNQSKETLDFVAGWGRQFPWMRPLLERLERRSWEFHGVKIDYSASYWTPPMTPSLAMELESGQIERLGLESLVSLSDHDTISAPQLLRAAGGAHEVPISVEWTAPFAEQSFHLGVHNLPAARATAWMQRLAAYTAQPAEPELRAILADLNAEPEVLVIFNHPLWDLYLVGQERHSYLVNEFLQKYGARLHALELNGLRAWRENQAVCRLAESWNMLLVSGGDRHGVEPNANINLTRARSFSEFVYELRRERQSQVLFLSQYAEPWKHRLLRSTLDAIRTYPEFPAGSRRWDERVYHPDREGVLRPLNQLWPQGSAPRAFGWAVAMVQMLGMRPLSGSLRLAWGDRLPLDFALNESEL